MASKNFPIFPTVFMLTMLGTLLYLGFWQVDRLGQKETLLARIDTRLSGEPVTLPIALPDPSSWEYRRVNVTGTFNHKRELYVFLSGPNGGAGYHVYTPLVRENASTVIVNRGWVPANMRDPATRLAGQLEGPQGFEGIVRIDRVAVLFQPPNDAAANMWFSPTIPEMAAAMELSIVAPVFVDAGVSDIAGGWPQGGVTRINIPNNHFVYALTWFGLVLALMVVFVIWWRRRP
jgi:surfeit locus 1 family protein